MSSFRSFFHRPAIQNGLLLLLAILTLFFSNGRWIIPLAAWIYPVFFMRFLRRVPLRRGIIAVLLVEMIVNTAAWWGTASSRLNLLQAIPAGLGILLALPLLLDRWLAPRLPGLAGTLVYPTAYILLEWLIVTVSPMGSVGMLAYTQFDNLVLVQLVSLTGTAGLGFLLAWSAALIHFAWEKGFSVPALRQPVGIYLAVLALVLVYGGTRLTFSPLSQNSVRVAGITLYGRPEAALMNAAQTADQAAFLKMNTEIQQEALSGTLREAAAGAQVVLWHEGSINMIEDPAPFLAQASALARQAGIYLVVPLYVTHPTTAQMDENKLVIFDPAGQTVLTHLKFGSASLEEILPGDGILRTVSTPYGVLSAAICRDLDFPAVLRQAGRNSTDFLVAPSFDWYEIDPFHSRYAVFRAVENGVSLFRQVSSGLSIAVDPFGRVISSMDYFASNEQVMVAQLPSQHVPTLYSYFGEWFNLLNAAGLAVLLWFGWRRDVSDLKIAVDKN